MTEPLVYALALTRGARALCDRLALTVQHFETEEELIEAVAAQVPVRQMRPTRLQFHQQMHPLTQHASC